MWRDSPGMASASPIVWAGCQSGTAGGSRREQKHTKSVGAASAG